MNEKKIIGFPQKTNNQNIKIINKAKINNYYIKNLENFRETIIKNIFSTDRMVKIRETPGCF